MNSTHDLGNPSCAPWLRTSTSHSSSAIFHLYELTILNRPIGFALQTKSFNNIHVNRSSHRVVRLRIFVERENSLEVKNFTFSPLTPPTLRGNLRNFDWRWLSSTGKEATERLLIEYTDEVRTPI
jgi:hypothetical protein